ncbi:helix-turn-helix domain-containing protein [Virgibacillus dakarensis]|nr:helix-turn-helix domain-containing protein [Virgibacillus dakarensis]MBT2215954.1 helix-turn-helix domain-containing protein [Virgibacillus dakarensis]
MAYKVGRCLLRSKLQDANMSQLELATKLNVTRQQINKYVSDPPTIMTLQVAKNIAAILHCSIEDLYEWIEVGDKE